MSRRAIALTGSLPLPPTPSADLPAHTAASARRADLAEMLGVPADEMTSLIERHIRQAMAESMRVLDESFLRGQPEPFRVPLLERPMYYAPFVHELQHVSVEDSARIEGAMTSPCCPVCRRGDLLTLASHACEDGRRMVVCQGCSDDCASCGKAESAHAHLGRYEAPSPEAVTLTEAVARQALGIGVGRPDLTNSRSTLTLDDLLRTFNALPPFQRGITTEGS